MLGEILRSLHSFLECRALASSGDTHVDISTSNMLPHQPSAHLCAREHLSSVFSGHCFRLTLTQEKEVEIKGGREHQAVCQLQGGGCPQPRKSCGGRRDIFSGITSCGCSHFQGRSGQGSLPKGRVLGPSLNSLRSLSCLGRGWLDVEALGK